MIELMIVVAIIGILAVVAIPGYMQYIKNSKTAEAKDNLKAIADGALTYFQAEHAADAAGMTIYTKQYPGCGGSNCSNSGVGTVPSEVTVGTKTSPSATAVVAALAADPFKSLKYEINKPFYYYYNYSSFSVAGNKASGTGDDAVAAKNPSSTFCARASASLSEALDSVFNVQGTADGKVGNIVEIETDSDMVSTCTAPGASST